MYCILKYISFEEYERSSLNEDGSSKLSLKKLSQEDFPRNKELLFNPNCTLQLIIDYIQSEVGINPNVAYDFSTETGTLLKIDEFKSITNGLSVFTKKEKYFIVIHKKNSSGELLKSEPLLNKQTSEYSMYKRNCSRKSLISRTGSSRCGGMTSRSSKGSIISSASILMKTSKKRVSSGNAILENVK